MLKILILSMMRIKKNKLNF